MIRSDRAMQAFNGRNGQNPIAGADNTKNWEFARQPATKISRGFLHRQGMNRTNRCAAKVHWISPHFDLG
jgi:hypothetical protein